MALQSQESIVFENYKRHGRPIIWITALVFAGVVTCALLFGYVSMHNRYAPQASVPQVKTPPVPRAQVLQNELFLRDSQAVISGTVRNISTETLGNLSVKIELTRLDETTEERTTVLVPSLLAPGEEGLYTLTLPARDWRAARVAAIRDGDDDQHVAFSAGVGAPRPSQAAPRRPAVTQRPRQGNSNDEFFNTPDNPVVIR